MSNTVWYQIGTYGKLNCEASIGFQKVRRLYMKRKQDLYITSIGEGDHRMDSRHYMGNAWD